MKINQPIARLSSKETTLGVERKPKTKKAVKINPIKLHTSYKSARLYSIGSRHYFEYNGNTFSLTKALLNKVLSEIKYNDYNFIESAHYLISLCRHEVFKKISK